jgi:hypothetical protein
MKDGFFEVVADAARDAGLTSLVIPEKQLFPKAVIALRRSEAALKNDVTALGRQVKSGWRAEQKAAALAAWIVRVR